MKKDCKEKIILEEEELFYQLNISQGRESKSGGLDSRATELFHKTGSSLSPEVQRLIITYTKNMQRNVSRQKNKSQETRQRLEKSCSTRNSGSKW